jgi:hypothetical protein
LLKLWMVKVFGTVMHGQLQSQHIYSARPCICVRTGHTRCATGTMASHSWAYAGAWWMCRAWCQVHAHIRIFSSSISHGAESRSKSKIQHNCSFGPIYAAQRHAIPLSSQSYGRRNPLLLLLAPLSSSPTDMGSGDADMRSVKINSPNATVYHFVLSG